MLQHLGLRFRTANFSSFNKVHLWYSAFLEAVLLLHFVSHFTNSFIMLAHVYTYPFEPLFEPLLPHYQILFRQNIRENDNF